MTNYKQAHGLPEGFVTFDVDFCWSDFDRRGTFHDHMLRILEDEGVEYDPQKMIFIEPYEVDGSNLIVRITMDARKSA